MIEYNECTIGRLVNVAYMGEGLKVGVIVGFTRTGKVRVCKWSSNSRSWSGPQNLGEHQLYAINLGALTARHRRICQAAHESVKGGEVNHAKGMHRIGGPPFLGPAREFSRAKDGPPVTKLAPAIGVAAVEPGQSPIIITDESKRNLQKLNKRLATALFGKDEQP